jgi:hypothetical protein
MKNHYHQTQRQESYENVKDKLLQDSYKHQEKSTFRN